MGTTSLLPRITMLLAVVSAGCAGGDPTVTDSTPAEAAITESAVAEPGQAPAQQDVASVSAAAAGEFLTLRLDETLRHAELELRWLKIEDSRCPVGVTCVWAGQVQATLEVSKNGEATQTVTLLRRSLREPEITQAFGYHLRLLEVDPHPKENMTYARSEYSLRLEIY